MKWLSRLDRRFGEYGIPNLTLVLVAGQVFVYLLTQSKPESVASLELVPQKVLEGQVWRVLSFLFVPPKMNAVFAFFAWYLFYLMGSALEQHWGKFRYNLFLLIGLVATVAVSFFKPDEATTNVFLGASVFLAFAYLCPDFVIYLAFIFPIRIVWLAAFTWLGLIVSFAFADWSGRLAVAASVLNFFLFFGDEVFHRVVSGGRRMRRQAREFAGPAARSDKPFHRCTVCGITEQSHPTMEFRYCGKCAGTHGYCMDHLRNHEHITADVPSTTPQP
jgi:hypothetical protein